LCLHIFNYEANLFVKYDFFLNLPPCLPSLRALNDEYEFVGGERSYNI
jgi:hypothetical protein